MKKLLIDLLRIPSVSSDISQLHKIVDYVENYFSGIDCIIEKFEFNNKPSIVVKNFEGKKADIVLNWHLDVVPPSEENQFDPYEENWKIYARGAWDMKSWVAIMMKLMKDLLKAGFSKKKISLILTTDEEVGGFDWVKKLVNLWYTGNIVLIPDAWYLDKIVYAGKGFIHLDLEFYGKSAHASRCWLGDNAIDNMINFYTFIKSYIQDDKKLYYDDNHWGSSVCLDVVEWGKATNMLCDLVKAKIDIRFTEDFTLDSLLDLIDKGLKRFNGKLVNLLTGDLLFSSPDNIEIQKYYKIAKNYIPNVELGKEHWGSDWRFFSAAWSIVLLHRPTFGNGHWKKEWVKVKDMEIIYNIYKDFILL